MRRQIARLVDDGKSEEQIVQFFIDQYGSQEPLAMPLNKGLYRLSWMFPIAVGAIGAVIAGSVAIRWSKKRQPEPDQLSPADPRLDERLDDELRNLD